MSDIQVGRNRRRRLSRVLLASLAVMLAALGALSYRSAATIRSRLEQGWRDMVRGRELLLAGTADDAVRSFADARGRFSSALAEARAPWLRAIGWLPGLGRTPDAVTAIASAGGRAAEAAGTIARAVAALPGGIASLTPTEGRIPLEPFTPLAEAFRRADRLTGDALETVADAPRTLLIPPVGSARETAEDLLRPLHRSVHAGSLLLEAFPRSLGADGERRYFVGAENPAELRGTGGLIGAYSILTVDGGRFRLGPFVPIQSLPTFPPEQVPAPNPDYARNYDLNRRGNGFWLNINMTPDFPSAAQAILAAYRESTEVQLDGVITADPFALAALLAVTGPTTVPGLGVRVDAGDVVAFTANRAYAAFSSNAVRKSVLGDVARSVLERFLSQTAPSLDTMRVLAGAASEGHVNMYSTDPTMQEGLARTGVGGALPPPSGDFLSVVQNNAAQNKLDFYLERSISYSVHLLDAGAATAEAEATFANDAPRSGLPRYVIGPTPLGGAGENVALVNLYCGTGCELRGARRNGRRVGLVAGIELGHRFYQDLFRIPSGATTHLDVALRLPTAWEGDGSGGTYRLTFLNQTTIRPTRLRVEVRVPDGMRVTGTSVPMGVDGDTAVWEGTAPGRLDLRVSFAPPWPARIWRDVVRFLSRSVIGL